MTDPTPASGPPPRPRPVTDTLTQGPADRPAPASPRPAPADPTPAGGSSPTFPSAARGLLADLGLGSAYDPASSAGPSGTLADSGGPPDRGNFSLAPAGAPSVAGYELREEIGRGGMGVVYKARHTKLHRTVALKMMLAGARPAHVEVVRFLAEAEAVAAVRHPNVVQVYDLGEYEGRPYFAMEFLEGGSLSGWLRDRTRAAGDAPTLTGLPAAALTPDEAAELTERIARGVHAAHAAGIVHRDIKPSNIIFGTDGAGGSQAVPTGPLAGLTPKVSDFGLAKRAASDLTRTDAVMGTPSYMAPEQAGGRAKFVGPPADVYSVGVILYELLTGGPPFTGDEPWSVVTRVLNDTPARPRARAPGVPTDLELICLKCLEKEPEHRYPTAEALADDLARFRRREAVTVRPTPGAVLVWRWVRKNPYPSALAATAALLLFVGVPLALVLVTHLGAAKDVAEQAGKTAVQAAKAEAVAVALAAEEAKGRAAAEKLGRAQELFGRLNQVRKRSTDRAPGWTWANRDDLRRAVPLAADDPASLLALRDEAAALLVAADFRPADPLKPGMKGHAVGATADGRLVAVGEFKAQGFALPVQVAVLDAATGNRAYDLSFVPSLVRGGNGILVQDGARTPVFSPDGKRLFVATRGGWVHRYHLAPKASQPAASWKAWDQEIGYLEVSPGGRWVAASIRAQFAVRDAETGKPVAFEGHDSLRTGTFHPVTGEAVAVTHRATAGRFDPATGKPTRPEVPTGGLLPALLRFTPDGRALLAADGPRLHLLHPDHFHPVGSFIDPEVRRAAHTADIVQVAVHPTGGWAATCTGADADRAVKVWAVASGRLVGKATVPGKDPLRLAWAGGGRTLVATTGLDLVRFAFAPPPAADWAVLQPAAVAAAGFGPGGREVVTLGEFVLPGDNARWLALRTPTAGAAPPPETGANEGGGDLGLAVHPGTGRAVLTGPHFAGQWPPGAASVPLPLPPGGARFPAFSPDGGRLWLVTTGPKVQGWDAATMNPVGTFSNIGKVLLTGTAAVGGLAADNDRVLVGGADGTVTVLDAATAAQVRVFPRGTDPVTAVAARPAGGYGAAGTQGGVLRLLDLGANAETAVPAAHPGGVGAVAFSRDGELLATGGADRAVRLWRRTPAGYEPLLTCGGLSAGVVDLRFGPADDRLLVVLAQENGVRVWDVAKLKAELVALGLGW